MKELFGFLTLVGNLLQEMGISPANTIVLLGLITGAMVIGAYVVSLSRRISTLDNIKNMLVERISVLEAEKADARVRIAKLEMSGDNCAEAMIRCKEDLLTAIKLGAARDENMQITLATIVGKLGLATVTTVGGDYNESGGSIKVNHADQGNKSLGGVVAGG